MPSLLRTKFARQIKAAMPAPALDAYAVLLQRYGRTSYAQEVEDMVLEGFLEGIHHGFYVDVGAFHPLCFANTYRFYRRGWHGINVEPNPDVAWKFKLLRPRDRHVQAGVAAKPGQLTWLRFEHEALNTFDVQRAQQLERLGHHVTSRQPVQVLRLETLLDKYAQGRVIDFLSVDAEGMDLEVLRTNAWTRHRPRFVLAESHVLSLREPDACPIVGFMAEQGYKLVARTQRTAFFRA